MTNIFGLKPVVFKEKKKKKKKNPHYIINIMEDFMLKTPTYVLKILIKLP
jgi:hypothetical protein